MITSIINQFVYRPDTNFAPADFTPANLSLAYEEIRVTTADGLQLSGWYLPAPKPHHALLYCHGNGGDIRDWVHAAPPFLEAGCSVLTWDYRGYGRSQGKPSEEGLYLDGEAAWEWLRNRAEKDNLPASILGKSLGSAVAIHAAIKYPPHRLILDSAFTSMREVVAANAPWVPGGIIPPLYELLKIAPQLICPTLIIHGRRLFDALTCPKTIHVIDEAEHNDISLFPDYHPHIIAFLD